MTIATPQAANPRNLSTPGYAVAAWLIGGITVAFVIGSLIAASLGVNTALLNLDGIVVSLAVAGGTYWLSRAHDHHDAKLKQRDIRRAAVALGVALVLWLAVVAAIDARLSPGALVISLPPTAFAIWVLRRLDRNQTEPWRMVLVALAWGGIVATNLAVITESIFTLTVVPGIVPGAGQGIAGAFAAGFFEELPKGAAVLLLYLVMRDRFDDVVDGLIFGALVGLGFNLVESVKYMSNPSMSFWQQFYLRQVLGLFTGHLAYTALIGAGIGIARQQRGLIRKVLAMASGFVVGIAGHVLWDAVVSIHAFPASRNENVELFVLLPIQTLVMDGFFLALGLSLLIAGLRYEGTALREELRKEADSGSGAVLTDEVDVLASPTARAGARRRGFTTGGRRQFRRLQRLQWAQLALAMERWHRARQEIDEPLAAEEELRDKVLAIRAEFPAPAI